MRFHSLNRTFVVKFENKPMKRVRYYLCLILLLLLSVTANAGINDLLPQPKSIQVFDIDSEGQFSKLTGRMTCAELPNERIRRAFVNLLGQ